MKILGYVTERRVVCVCDGCGTSVTKNLSQVNINGPIFCTTICRNQNYKIAKPEWSPKVTIYTRVCRNCGIPYTVNGRRKRCKVMFCSVKCKGQAQSKLPGHKHSEETKKQIAEAQREHCKNHGNQFLTGKSAGKHTHETICIISAKNCGKEPQWKGRVFQYDGPGGRMKLRSSYELFYARWLDDQGIKWEYEPKFKLSNGKTFSPDFRLETGVIIEVKGVWTPIGKEKWTLFCNDYPGITKQVLMKDDLISLGMKG